MKTNKLASRMTRQSNLTETENSALTYRSSLDRVLDFFYLAPARQGQDNLPLFFRAFEQDPALALKAAFYLRDVRGGKQQKKTFQDILRHLISNERKLFNQLVLFVPEYGYWKDILGMVNSPVVRNMVKSQLDTDLESPHPSLLAKWMPSENTSSENTRKLAKMWRESLGMSERNYRKLLSDLRRRIGVVEVQMSAQEWEQINYSYVPSKAMKTYRKAFRAHDEERFIAFTEKAIKGEVKIQSRTLYPHEIAAEFLHGSGPDKALEAQWNQLPNYFGDEHRNVLVMVDVSASMGMEGHTVSGKARPIDIAVALGVYCAERNQGPFHNLWISFSGHPTIQKLEGSSLYTKLHGINNSNVGYDTNLQRAFEVLLHMAIEDDVAQEDMPSTILVISDMEFNSSDVAGKSVTNLESVRRKYQAAGYDMPLLTFWNVDARHDQVPATKDENGVFLVSGFSAETIGKVLNAKSVTPVELMLEVLNSERYSFVDSLKL